jgi:hypothetical protein
MTFRRKLPDGSIEIPVCATPDTIGFIEKEEGNPYMAISLRQTLAQLATHTHTYDSPSYGLAAYQDFLSFPQQYAELLIAFRGPNSPPSEGAQTGPPDFSS